MFAKVFILLVALTMLPAMDVAPDWVLRGIAKTESRSYYNESGDIIYVDKRRGAAGERGPFQMTRGAFNQVANKAERPLFWKLETDTVFAEYMACKYLDWLHDRTKNWDQAVMAYNRGLTGSAWTYLHKVKTNALP